MRRTLPTHSRDRVLLQRVCVLSIIAAMMPGCGSSVYQQRLSETVSYFEYKEQLNRELGRAWSEQGISFRPPRQFTLIPPPNIPQDDDGGTVFILSADDPRQPHYLGIELPGLLAAWEADVTAEDGDSQSQQKAYLYVLSNHDRHLLEDGGDPHTLINDVENGLAAAVGVFLEEGISGSGREKNSRYREVVPGGLPHSRYRPQQEFIAVTLSPAVQPLDVPIEMQLYEWSGKEIQVVILMVYPADISPQEDLQERLLLALETFEASDQASRSSGPTGPAPAGRRVGGF